MTFDVGNLPSEMISHTLEDWKIQQHYCEILKPYEVLAVETSLHERSHLDKVNSFTINTESSCLWSEP